jgi:hypothetical protein
MSRILTGAMILTGLSTSLAAQAAPKGPVEGVWKVAGIVVTGADSMTVSSPQPGLFFFTKTHYSQTWVPGDRARAIFRRGDPSPAEKEAAFDSFFAQTGTYDLADSSITIHPMVARFPNMEGGGSARLTFRVRGDTLWLIQKSADIKFRMGTQIQNDTGRPSETRLTLIRVE